MTPDGLRVAIDFLHVIAEVDPLEVLSSLINFNSLTFDIPLTLAVPYKTFSFSNEFGTYNASVYVDGATDLPAPCMEFIHGFGARSGYYGHIADHVISLGLVAIMIDTPGRIGFNPRKWSRGFSSCIDAIVADEDLYSIVNVDKIGASGHSFGGLGTVIAAAEEPRLKCAIPMSPAIFSGWLARILKSPDPEELTVPTQMITGTLDRLINYRNVQSYFDRMTCPKDMLLIEGANHVQFLDPEMADLARLWGLIDNKPTIPVEEVHRIMKEKMTTWCLRYL